jgi:hypothetical protein
VVDELFSQSWAPWEAYGVTPTDIAGWSFFRGRTDDRHRAVRAASDLVLTVLSPVDFTVANDAASVAGPPSWHDRIRLDDSRLIFRLPLIARAESQVLVLPPGGIPAVQAEFKMAVYDRTSGELELIWQLNAGERFTVRTGQPLAQIVALAGALRPDVMKSQGLSLRIWRLHPQGIRICPAEKTLRGDASSGAMRWCGPFTHANSYGFWVFSPVDMDVIWHGGRSFEHRFQSLYTNDDVPFVSRLQRPKDSYRYSVRKKVDFGSVLESVVSIWTGCVFQTPPGWSLMIRNPVNINASEIFRAQEAILETDWLPYDIWLNLLFVQQGKWARLRRSDGWPPIAQLLPVPRIAYDRQWGLVDGPIERTTVEGSDLFERWLDYNTKKWVKSGQKDPATYHRERRRRLAEDNPTTEGMPPQLRDSTSGQMEV